MDYIIHRCLWAVNLAAPKPEKSVIYTGAYHESVIADYKPLPYSTKFPAGKKPTHLSDHGYADMYVYTCVHTHLSQKHTYVYVHAHDIMHCWNTYMYLKNHATKKFESLVV